MITQADIDAAAAFFRDDRTGLATKFNLGHDPSPLLDAFARHRHEAELRGIKLMQEAAAKVPEYARDRRAIRALAPAAVQRGE